MLFKSAAALERHSLNSVLKDCKSAPRNAEGNRSSCCAPPAKAPKKKSAAKDKKAGPGAAELIVKAVRVKREERRCPSPR